MSEPLEHAEVRPSRRLQFSPIWLVPLAALLMGAWLFYQDYATRGLLIVLELRDAEGLQEGRTPVKLRNVEVGVVEDVQLSEDFSAAVAEVRMQPALAPLLVEDTRFWVVKPRVGPQGVSGLETIVSGAYIQMRPGQSENRARRFDVLEQPPVTQADVPGLSIVLTSAGDEGLSIGDPVLFQGQSVGRIETAELDLENLNVHYSAFIESPYDRLITENTQFWPRSGLDLQISSQGVDVSVGNLQALLAGGVTFGLFEQVSPGGPVSDGAEFVLYASRQAALEQRFSSSLNYVVLFEDSVRDLYPGAAVEFRGIRLGTVLEVPYFPKGTGMDDLENFRVPVRIAIEPDRLAEEDGQLPLDEWRRRLADWADSGLRASLEAANLLTGALFVDLVFVDTPTWAAEQQFGPYPVFPSTRGGFASLEMKVTQLIDKLNALPLSPVMEEAEQTLGAARALLERLSPAAEELDALLGNAAGSDLPGRLTRVLAELESTLASYRSGQPVYDNLNRSLESLNAVLDDLAPLIRTLRERPNALIFGRTRNDDDPIPRAADDAN